MQPAPYPNFVGTPDTGEAMTPITKYTTLQPTKLHFSPRSAFSTPKKQRTVYYGLMYPTHQAIRDKPLQIEDIQTIFASPILQEQIHYMLMDYSLDETKIADFLKYLGIPKCIFLQYINRAYPQHYYTYLTNLN